jgi:exosortase
LLIWERKSIFGNPRYSPLAGTLGLLPGVILYGFAEVWQFSLSPDDRLFLAIVAMVLLWIGGFVLFYGMESLRSALFPLFFLLMMAPLPPAVLDRSVSALQTGSAQVTYALFKLIGMPVLWRGVNFSLPGIDIEIAKECSGIRSCVALFITGLLAGHVFLRSGWRQAVLCLATIPIAIFKNAVRIVTISSLGIYVDRGFLYGSLHHQGGVLFALIALGMFVPLLFALQRSETRNRTGRPGSEPRSTGNEGRARQTLGAAAR